MTVRSDLEADYNNRARVPDHPQVMARWKAASQAARDAHPPRHIAHGASARERLDWFGAGPGAPVVVFIHGGYWQALDGDWVSFVAPPLLAHGVSVVVPTYDLCPAVRLGRIVDQMRAVTDVVRAETGRRPLVAGHSAGGHLAACLLSEGRASAALAISGVFDLRPLVETSLNEALDLQPLEAAALSPLFWPAPNGGAPGGTALDCWVGAAESDAFRAQSRTMAETWAAAGADTRCIEVEGADHFTVLDPLFDEKSAMVRRLVEMAEA
ncbi:hypothetical protein ASG17_04195 [Brevundimonas sp. Leaf363]|uniref:alpha/beta hydrolase n=1 Tax=Brevundimonas sp. Leaf363 TaxID=1736353 RepID=UPI0006FF30E4|nr:alpha/beta hydrolase [Brevundimonas sp. Leaf363]KQS55302.1 hypothetical protein ASG17_04195 [Brevundimonas sp. Leaf363]